MPHSVADHGGADSSSTSMGEPANTDQFIQASRAALSLSKPYKGRSAAEIGAFIDSEVRPKLSDPPFPTKRPARLPGGDDRFEKSKFARRYVCDSCGNLVGFSSKKGRAGGRYDYELAGSYVDHGWASLPAVVHKLAYESKLIDCTWWCN